MSLAPSLTQPNFLCNEHELVAAVRQGSDRAFEELYSRYRSRISSYIYGMVGDHGRAEDIAQEVFISALRRLRETERPIAFKPWIYEIAKNACIDEFRRTKRLREVPLEPDESSEAEIESWRPGPDAAMAHKESLSDLKSAFHGLSENHHKIIVMRELEGLSYSQIGERLGMSRPVVESTLFRARKRLSEEYDELVTGRRCDHVQVLIAGEERRSLLKLGVRERRQLARHLAHCQPCRREARMAGVDESFFKAPKTLAGKIAALLPFPWLRWRRSNGGSEDAATSHSWNAVQGAQTVARLADPTGPAAGFGRAAAAAAAIAVVGIGSGVVTGAVGSHGHASRPAATAARVSAGTPAAAHIASSSAGGSRSQTGHSQQTGGSGGGSGANGSGGGSGASVGSGSGSSAAKPSSGAGSGSASSPSAQSGGSGSGSGSGGATANGGGSHGGVTTPSLPGVKLPAPKLPTLKTGLPLPKLPTVTVPQLPKVQVPQVKVPGVQVPDPNKLLGKLIHP
jgi:RNA polymerase sigma factor (sigma-70 family)